MSGRKSKEALLFPPSPCHKKLEKQVGPIKVRVEGGMGPLVGYTKEGWTIGFYGDAGAGAGAGNHGGGGAAGGGWSRDLRVGCLLRHTMNRGAIMFGEILSCK
jgi:hypothetical protein